ncbi:MAG: cyclic nucleotide-binding domain-containing protein [Chloroflexi bacterium]|nr:cyclic nucleotide-binding domain-containing protein [Chloroflexota bacterium]
MPDTHIIDKIAILKQTFDGLTDDELSDLAKLTHLTSYPEGHILCREGAFEEVFYIVADGQAVITKKISDHESERVLRNAGPGDFVGEMALIQNAPRAATVRAVTECTVLEMGKSDFESMLRRSPRMALSIIRTTLSRMRANDQMAIQDLQRTNKLLRVLDRNKLEFIQVAAHELRTPLTVLKGYVNVMKSLPQMKDNAAIAEIMDGINKGAERMHEIVNMMLDVTRIDNDTLRIVPSPVPIRSVVNEVVHDFSKGFAERNIAASVEHAEDTPMINADPTLVQKALYHLIMNAIKYTPDGGQITIRTRPVKMERDRPGVEVSIKDTGIGLDSEHQELIFEKFYQVGSVALHSSSKTAFKGGGPGLGLAIARGVARAHGGKIWVESAGHDETHFPGSTFYLQLPLNPPAA